VALLQKMTCNLRHPMGLRHPVVVIEYIFEDIIEDIIEDVLFITGE